MTPLPRWQAALLRAGARIASPGGRRGALIVLIYHRVLPAPDLLLADEPDAATFAAQMDFVADMFRVLPLADAVNALGRGTLPPRAAAITFDDGYANNLEVAAPILTARGITASFFIATGFVDGGAMWNDLVIDALRSAPAEFDLDSLGLGRYALPDMPARRQALDKIIGKLKYKELPERLRCATELARLAGISGGHRPMMSESQLRELARLGMDVGAHCVQHPILARLAPAEARREIFESKARLGAITGQRVRTFAYPNGRPGIDYGPEHVAMVREAGFSAAVTTAWGAASRGIDPMQIPRVAPWDRTPLKYGLRLLRACTERSPRTAHA